jgi:hypothetical protein
MGAESCFDLHFSMLKRQCPGWYFLHVKYGLQMFSVSWGGLHLQKSVSSGFCGMNSSDVDCPVQWPCSKTGLDSSYIPSHWSFAQIINRWILLIQSVTSLYWLLRCLLVRNNSPFLLLHFPCLVVNSQFYGDEIIICGIPPSIIYPSDLSLMGA